jgi:hypothetical protein
MPLMMPRIVADEGHTSSVSSMDSKRNGTTRVVALKSAFHMSGRTAPGSTFVAGTGGPPLNETSNVAAPMRAGQLRKSW